MKIEIVEEEGVFVVILEGRMDSQTCQDFDKSIICHNNLLKGQVLLDLSHLDFINSAGLRSILILGKQCHYNGYKLAFCSPTDMVNEVFKISGFYSIFSVHPDKKSALLACKNG